MAKQKIASLQPVKGGKGKSLMPPKKEIVVRVSDKKKQRSDTVYAKPVPDGPTYDDVAR
jgi:hypothetical protein